MARSKRRNGFVYEWHDRKRNLKYVGSHMGREDDGYVCSSDVMAWEYFQRPHDFTRTILERWKNVTRNELYEREQAHLDRIPCLYSGSLLNLLFRTHYNKSRKARPYAPVRRGRMYNMRFEDVAADQH